MKEPPTRGIQAQGRSPAAAPAHAVRGASVLAVQRLAGNRAVSSLLARRVIGVDTPKQIARFEVGVELTPKLAQAAWELTKTGPLDETGVGRLRAVALEHWMNTIDDNERLFIAALLDAGNAAKLHAEHPAGFTEGKVIDFDGSRITEANRNVVKEFGRNARPAFDPRSPAKDDFDRQIIALGGKGWGWTVQRVLAMADAAGISHMQVYYAMLNGASDSTGGDRALAGAAFVIGKRAGMRVADEILRGNLKVDEVSPSMLSRISLDARAGYVPTAGGGLKGDTLYLPSNLDVDDLGQQGTVIHELEHAHDDWLFEFRGQMRTADYELSAYRRQAAFYLSEIAKRTGTDQDAAIDAVVRDAGPVRIHLLVAEVKSGADDDYDAGKAIVERINSALRIHNPSAALDADDLRAAWKATAAENRSKARTLIKRTYDSHSKIVEVGGPRGESVLDRKPPDEPQSGRTLSRQPAKTYEQHIAIGLTEYVKDGVKVSSGVTEQLLLAAQKRLKKGPIKSVSDLAGLRKLALSDQTVSDAERLFLAGLLDPENAARIRAIELEPSKRKPLKLVFKIDDETQRRMREVAALGRPAAGTGKADAQIRKLAGGSDSGRAAKLLAFAKERKVSQDAILEAMRAAASDATSGDLIAAGIVYAVAAAAGLAVADDIKAGRIKVDEMPVTQAAYYSPTGAGGLNKGDTVYVPPGFDIASLDNRATVIHELKHAEQDKAVSARTVTPRGELEPAAYVAGAKYVLDEIARVPEKSRAAVVKKVAASWGRHHMYAAVSAMKQDPAKLRPILDAINAARKERERLDKADFDSSDSAIEEHIRVEIRSSASGQVALTGLTGESGFDAARL